MPWLRSILIPYPHYFLGPVLPPFYTAIIFLVPPHPFSISPIFSWCRPILILYRHLSVPWSRAVLGMPPPVYFYLTHFHPSLVNTIALQLLGWPIIYGWIPASHLGGLQPGRILTTIFRFYIILVQIEWKMPSPTTHRRHESDARLNNHFCTIIAATVINCRGSSKTENIEVNMLLKLNSHPIPGLKESKTKQLLWSPTIVTIVLGRRSPCKTLRLAEWLISIETCNKWKLLPLCLRQELSFLGWFLRPAGPTKPWQSAWHHPRKGYRYRVP